MWRDRPPWPTGVPPCSISSAPPGDLRHLPAPDESLRLDCRAQPWEEEHTRTKHGVLRETPIQAGKTEWQENCYDGAMATGRKKTTVYLDPELLRAVESLAANTGRHDYEIVEDALRQYLGPSQEETSRQALREMLDQLAGHEAVSDEEALNLAYAELDAARSARHQD